MTIVDDDIIGTWSSFVVMASSLPHALADLTSFRAREVINDGRDVHGRVVVLGAFDGCDEDALVKLQRSPLPHDLDGVRALLRRVRLRARAPYSGAEYVKFLNLASFGNNVDVIPSASVTIGLDK